MVPIESSRLGQPSHGETFSRLGQPSHSERGLGTNHQHDYSFGTNS